MRPPHKPLGGHEKAAEGAATLPRWRGGPGAVALTSQGCSLLFCQESPTTTGVAGNGGVGSCLPDEAAPLAWRPSPRSWGATSPAECARGPIWPSLRHGCPDG